MILLGVAERTGKFLGVAGRLSWRQPMPAAADRTYPRRSCLSVPGHAVRMHEKALGVSADEVVFDLEDSVAPGAKQQAREAIAATLAQPAWARRTVAVRINPPSSSELA